MRWLMTLGERSRPDHPRFAAIPAPHQARAWALVDDFDHLFPVLREWRRAYGDGLTAWAVQVEANDVTALPAQLTSRWEEEGDLIRLDTEPGGYVRVADYRDTPARAGISACIGAGPPVWTTAEREGSFPVATFTHATPERCAQLHRALSAAGLTWSDNGQYHCPQFLTYTVTDSHGRTWRIHPATNFQISPSSPGQIWQASCPALMTTTPVLSARQVAEHIRDVPA
ncbi:hypothetical protein [Streptomyces sp. NPDC052092]|uniref:hypothetical protein n=1 Tax=Streptomyces sp. NPDC052092 TaxID=3365685 RepID=UPI0037D3902E